MRLVNNNNNKKNQQKRRKKAKIINFYEINFGEKLIFKYFPKTALVSPIFFSMLDRSKTCSAHLENHRLCLSPHLRHHHLYRSSRILDFLSNNKKNPKLN